jgi:hypothetical protein
MNFNIRPTVIETVDLTSTAPYSLSAGQSAQGNISNTYDYDYFTLAVTAGQKYSIALVGTGQRPMNDPYLRILDSLGGEITSNDDVGTYQYKWSELTYTATRTENLTIKVGSYGTDPGGQYGLSVNPGAQFNFDYLMGAGAIHSDASSSWGSGQGQGVTVSYGFRYSAATYTVSDSNIASFSKLNAAQKDAVNLCLELWSDICGIKFVAVNPESYTNNATILFGNYTDPNDSAGAFAYRPINNGNTTNTSSEGDVWLNLDSVGISTAALKQGAYSFYTIMHEIGHALGLTHPGPYNADGSEITYENSAKFIQDSGQYTVMSYFDGSETGQSPGLIDNSDTPMLFDILAMQNLYGANMNTRSGNTVYGFGANAGATYDFAINTSPQLCIWDAGGTDTLDCSGYSQKQIINLTEGAFSNIGGQTANVSIALNVTLENVIGGSGADTITGNSANNSIQGNAGNDIMYGGAGNDTFDWGSSSREGGDTMYGGAGDDVYVIDSVNDLVVEFANEGSDLIWTNFTYALTSIANAEGLYLYGTSNINATGNSLNNFMSGNSGKNNLDGGDGFDTVIYTDPRSSYSISYSNDIFTITGNQGTDTTINIEYFSFSDINIYAIDLINLLNPSNFISATLTPHVAYFVKTSNLNLTGTSFIDEVVYSSAASNFAVSITGSQVSVIDATGILGTTILTNIERLSFTDTMLALDTGANENAGNSYLLYQAAFDRTPDVEGLGYWISKVDGGANMVKDVALNFILSNEFISLYGANPTVPQFMDLLYQNVLNRSPDQEGLNYWLREFARDGDSTLYRAGILNNFAISAENIANVADQIVDGIQYQAYVG